MLHIYIYIYDISNLRVKPLHVPSLNMLSKTLIEPIPVASQSKAWFCGCSLDGTGGFESRREHGYLSLVNVVCCEVEASASG